MFNGCHGMGTAGWVVMALLWVAVLAAIVWLIAHVTGSPLRDERDHEDPRASGGRQARPDAAETI